MNTPQAMILAGAMIGFGLSGMPAASAADSCSDVLSHGIFNTYSLSESASLRKSFHSWLCTTEFKTHQEAQDAGVGIGVPIYGVPVQIDGNFSQQQRDEWKKTNCQTEDRALSSDQALKIATSQVSSEIIEAWKSCMDHEHDARGLSCQMRASTDQVMITVKYAPYNDADARSAAQVTSLPELTGARCAKLNLNAPAAAPAQVQSSKPVRVCGLFGCHTQLVPVLIPAPAPTLSPDVLQLGSSVHVQGYTLLCTRDGNDDDGRPEVRFVLNTDKGTCSPSVSPAADTPMVIEGNVTYPSDARIVANRVVFKKGARITIQNGSTFEVFAKKVVVEDDVFFDGHGARGPQGSTGFSPPGDWSTDDRKAYDDANGDCSHDYNHPDRGGRGGQGGSGGTGATIKFHANVIGDVSYSVDGGPGGPGGGPGSGRVHLYRGGNAWRCGENGSGPDGGQGAKGSFAILPPLS